MILAVPRECGDWFRVAIFPYSSMRTTRPARKPVILSLCRNMPFILRQVVGDGEPRRLGADEDMRRRPDRRIVDQRSHCDMHIGAVPDDGVKQRSARLAARVIPVLVAE